MTSLRVEVKMKEPRASAHVAFQKPEGSLVAGAPFRRAAAYTAIVAVVTAASMTGCSPVGTFKVTAVPSDQSLEERIVWRDPGWVSDRIAIIDISGILMNAYESGLLSEGEHAVSLTVEKLNAAAKDKRVKGIVLRINSPGGTVTASDTLYQEIRHFREKTGKPVIAYFQDVAASGAYYVACAADEIIAQRTSVTGSIGVVMQMVDLSGTMAKLGIATDAIKSGPYKDAGSPFRRMEPEEREVFQSLVDGFYQQFLDVVAAGRPALSREKIANLADGRVYVAEQAVEAGLVDRIATFREAIDITKERAGIKSAHVVIYHRPLDWRPTIYAEAPPVSPRIINLFNINLPSLWTKRPQFVYIWCVSE
ncbi:MAG: signal peptide peptidase SppA [Phycisphaerae bacterium]|nr:signal peptide peptidase SppA [Phycisphaerae bacterium]